jgi:hypothetical protein
MESIGNGKKGLNTKHFSLMETADKLPVKLKNGN